MQNIRSTLGPRGWAMLTLVAGAGLASPFLRPPQVDLTEHITESPLARTSLPARFASVSGTTTSASSLPGTTPQLDIHDLETTGPMFQRQVQIPEWASPQSPLDELISQGAAPPWQHEPTANSPGLAPLAPWTSKVVETTQPSASTSISSALRPVSVNDLPTASNNLTSATVSTPAAPVLPQVMSDPTPKRAQFVYQPGYQPLSK